MKKLYLVLSLLFCSEALQAQDFPIPKWQLSLSYFGEMVTHGGIRLGITKPFAQKSIAKSEADFVNKGWVVGGYLTYYKHPRNHAGLMLTGAVGRQRIGKSGLQTSFNFETGYMLSVLDGEAYEWTGTEIVESSKSSSHAVFGFNAGIGWNFEKKMDVPFSFMVQPHFYFQAHYNTLLTPRVALETKLTYNLK